MRFWQKNAVLTTALALFAMLFGSGNIAFPLGLGRDLGNMASYAMLGFFISAALVPVLGIIAMALCHGDYRIFMERIGRVPAACVIFLCFALIGPFAVIPRCIAFSYLAVQWLFPQLRLLTFTLATGAAIIALTLSKNSVVTLMGRVLGPLKLGLLGAVIVKGFFTTSSVAPCTLAGWDTFVKGIISGYSTLDLLGIIFSSGLLLANLAIDDQGRRRSQQELMRMLIQAGILTALMLGTLYAGFVVIASMQSGVAACARVESSQLLSVLASIILGAGGGVLASITMAVACATTAIGLTTMFAEYVSTELPRGWLSYQQAIFLTIAIATFFANRGTSNIQAFLSPIVEVLYPALITLALLNIIDKALKINLGRWPFYVTLLGALAIRWVS